MKTIFLATAAVAALASAPASAATFLFTTTGLTINFSLPDSPTPAFALAGQGFRAPSTSATVNGNPQTLFSITFLNTNYNLEPGISGGFTYDGNATNVFNGAQLYSGTEANPTFLAGTYQLSQFQSGTAGVLVISGVGGAVPEPATWALLILGFGLTGAAMRRRTSSVAVSYA